MCRLFLRKECPRSSVECELSHDVDPNRTPECGLFLRGMCIDTNCGYLHVKKPTGAAECVDFLTSWCSLGSSCPKRHYVPPSTEKKREREESEPPEPNEDELLKHIWEETSTLKMYE